MSFGTKNNTSNKLTPDSSGNSAVGSRISVEEFNQIARNSLPFAEILGLDLISVDCNEVHMRARFSPDHLRPGGTVAGPVMMGLADAAIYALVLANVGPVELAVTTQLSINFLRKPAAADVHAVARVLKLGKRLAVCEVSMYSVNDHSDSVVEKEAVAHATATYSIPPASR